MLEPATPPRLAYRTVTITAIVLGMVLAVVIFHVAASAFFLIFGSLLLASIFCGFGRLIQRLGLPRWASLVLVYLLALAAIAVPLAWGGTALVQQAGDLLAGVRNQADELLKTLSGMGLPVGEDTTASDLEGLMPSGLASSAGRAVFGALGAFGNVFILLFLAIFISWQPGIYRDGLVSLFPRDKRARVAAVLEKAAHSLLMWVAGEGISMISVFTVSWVGLWLIGVNNAFLLALQAGLLAFIPTLGAFIGGAIIVLAALAQGPEMALWALGVYLLIQGVESNITTPIAQRWATSLPPALTLGAQLVFGLLFGLLGFVLAVPFVAVLMTLVRELYVDDVLGGPVGSPEGTGSDPSRAR